MRQRLGFMVKPLMQSELVCGVCGVCGGVGEGYVCD